MGTNWSTSVSTGEAARRAGGRRRYNRRRQNAAILRQIDIVGWWLDHAKEGPTLFDRGVQSLLAEKFGVSSSTVSRDYSAIFKRWGVTPCPTCSSPLALHRVEKLQRQGKVAITSPGEGQDAGDEARSPATRDLWMLLAEQERSRRQIADDDLPDVDTEHPIR